MKVNWNYGSSLADQIAQQQQEANVLQQAQLKMMDFQQKQIYEQQKQKAVKKPILFAEPNWGDTYYEPPKKKNRFVPAPPPPPPVPEVPDHGGARRFRDDD